MIKLRGVEPRRSGVAALTLSTLGLAALAAGCGDNIRSGEPGPTDLLQVTAVGAPSTSEAGAAATFEVVLTRPPAADVTVRLASSDPGEGVVSGAELVISAAAWDQPTRFTVTGVDDPQADGDQLYQVIADGGDAGRVELGLVNLDDDAPGFVIAPTTGLRTSEAGASATFTVSLASQPEGPVTIPLASSDATEGAVAPAMLTFTPQNWNATQTVTVTGADDAAQDGDQPYQVRLGAVSSTDPAYAGLDPDEVGVTNVDDDIANVFASPATGLETTEGGGAATFTVVLLAQPADDVTIPLTSSTPGEASVAPASVTFTPANWNAPQTVTVTGVDDAVVDGPAPWTVELGTVITTAPAYVGLDPLDVTGRNLDDDSAGVLVTADPGLRTTEAGGTAVFTVVLLAQPTAQVTIPVTSNDTTEGTAAPAQLVFDATTWSQPQTVTLTGVDDALLDGDVAYVVALGPATSGDAAYAGLDPTDVTLTNVDNETAGITVDPIADLQTSEFGDTDTFTIVLNQQPTSNVTIGLTSSDTTEGTVSPTSVTFTPLTWDTPQTVTVTGQNDPAIDGTQPYTIITAPAISGDPAYANLDAPNVSVTNLDDESPAVFVQTKKRLTTGENGQAAAIRIRLTTQPSADVVCALTSTDLTEGTVPASITFTPQTFSVLRSITVSPVDDAILDGDQLYSIQIGPCTSTDLGYDGFDPRDVQVLNRDND